MLVALAGMDACYLERWRLSVISSLNNWSCFLIACALSASEGWQEAVKKLGGAFAEEGSGLKERKGE